MKKLEYTKAAEYILGLPKFTKKNPQEHTRYLMEALGNPQDRRKVIHVAGTNGKGSVCAYMDSILREAKKTVGLFTSPHLIVLNERFRINGEDVSDEAFAEAFETVKIAVDEMMDRGFAHPTFFEMLFAMAAVLFDKAGTEYMILETGLGGRLDATNIVKKPAVTVITSVGLDHTDILGNTIEQIAGEKAGIIKAGVPVIADGTGREAFSVIKKRAEEMRCKCMGLIESGKASDSGENTFSYEIKEITNKNIDFLFKCGYYGSVRVLTPGIGACQVKNASLAIRAVLEVEDGLSADIIAGGLLHTRWPGRMEEILPGVYIDGAHNDDGIREFVRTVSCFKEKEKIILFSAVEDKDYELMIEHICREVKPGAVITAEMNTPRAVPYTRLSAVFRKYAGCPVHEIKKTEDAFGRALALQPPGGLVFCIGSLYLAGEIKEIVRRLKHDKF